MDVSQTRFYERAEPTVVVQVDNLFEHNERRRTSPHRPD